MDLCNTQHTPRVPKLVRETARSMLRHFPSDWDMQRTARMAPDVFQEKMDDLHKMILTYEQMTPERDQETVAETPKL